MCSHQEPSSSSFHYERKSWHRKCLTKALNCSLSLSHSSSDAWSGLSFCTIRELRLCMYVFYKWKHFRRRRDKYVLHSIAIYTANIWDIIPPTELKGYVLLLLLLLLVPEWFVWISSGNSNALFHTGFPTILSPSCLILPLVNFLLGKLYRFPFRICSRTTQY